MAREQPPKTPTVQQAIQELHQSADEANHALDSITLRELTTALHWTSKKDLAEALNLSQSTPYGREKLAELWDALVSADRGLQSFEPHQLQKIVDYNKVHQQHIRHS